MQDIRIGGVAGTNAMTDLLPVMAGTWLTAAGALAPDSANPALASIDAAIDFISCFRGELGAKQNAPRAHDRAL